MRRKVESSCCFLWAKCDISGAMNYNDVEIIHQVIITDSFDAPRELPNIIDENIRSTRINFPDAEHRLWTGKTIRSFIAEYFEPSVVEVFDELRPYAYKCDLARYCLLYILGGLYVDLGIRFMAAARIPADRGIMAFQDERFISPSWTSLSQSILWATPGRDEFRCAIDMISRNVTNRYYGANPLYPTGPVLLGRAFVMCMANRLRNSDADDQWIGIRLSHNRFITPDNIHIASSMKRFGGDLAHLGLDQTNNYNDFWRRRIVYGEKAALSWSAVDERIRVAPLGLRTAVGITFHGQQSGVLSFGPYISIGSGSYKLKLLFSPNAIIPNIIVEISYDFDKKLAAFELSSQELDENSCVELRFETDNSLENLEFRIIVDGIMIGELTKIELLEK